jgi:ribosomal protein S18 acetylase RimI-like enzyme
VEVRLLGAGDLAALVNAEPDVFDNRVEPELAEAFLADPRHHIVAAIADGRVVGFASAVDYLHPDKRRQLFVNEVGVAPRLHRRGIGLSLMRAIIAQARALGCDSAWVGTDLDNLPARALYRAAGGVPDEPNAEIFEFALVEAAPKDGTGG